MQEEPTPHGSPAEESPAQPIPTPTPAPTPGITIRGRRFGLPWILGGVVAVLLILSCGCCGSLALAGALAPKGTTAPAASTAVVTQAPATATATAKPKPTADTRVADYRAYVMLESNLVGVDFGDISAKCQSGQSYSDCRAAVQVTHDDVAEYLAGLKTHSVPACLAAADTSLRAGLGDYERATQLMLDGIDQMDVSKIDQGGTLMDTGNTEIQHATDAADNAVC